MFPNSIGDLTVNSSQPENPAGNVVSFTTSAVPAENISGLFHFGWGLG